MDKLEKAIAAVKYGIRAAECAGNGKNLGRSSLVMMHTDDLDDILDLLKAQEPRVMTLTELWYMEHKPVYLERKNSRLYMTEPSIVLKTERCYIPSLGDSYILMRENKNRDKYWACDYNKTWRCWTSRPTEEQREAVKWQ